MAILCKLFGHIPDHGYYRERRGGSTQYFKVKGGHVDGIKREHWSLYGKCRWCNKEYHVGNFHGPLNRHHPYGTIRFKQIQDRLKGLIKSSN